MRGYKEVEERKRKRVMEEEISIGYRKKVNEVRMVKGREGEIGVVMGRKREFKFEELMRGMEERMGKEEVEIIVRKK